VRRHVVGALDDDSAKRLPELDPGLRPGLAAELDHAAYRSDVGEEALVRRRDIGPTGKVDRPGRLFSRYQHPPEVVGQERHHRRDHP